MIYYVEDDTNIRDLALYALRQAGFKAEGFSCASDFFAGMEKQMPELILLDIMLPEIDGLEILRRLREAPQTKTVPVMMITARGTEYDTVTGLDQGADDYLCKPFGMMELVSRTKALIRRSSIGPAASADELVCGNVALSVSAHSVTAGGAPVELTLKEFDLLHALMANVGHVLTRDQLLQEVWSMSYVGGTRTVDVHVQTLRQKLAQACEGSDDFIKTVRGVGYLAKVEE